MKTIALGVTGSIAAYKAAELVSRLKKLGYNVRVVLTEAAASFVSPLTFQVLSENQTITSLFPSDSRFEIEHVSLADACSLLLIAPATADIISKIACGIGDDSLSTLALTMGNQILIAPAMNTRMWHNPVLQENVQRLKQRGVRFVDPEYGQLACGVEGDGRLASLERIIDAVGMIVNGEDVLEGRTVLITAGPTREMIDPVRYISNPSSGRMGYSLAKAARWMGARVILISGPACLDAPSGVELHRVTSACEMQDKVMKYLDAADIFISAAAVGDYMPLEVSCEKIKKDAGVMTLQLQQTPDILKCAAANKGSRIMVGFAVESQDLIENAAKKLRDKNLDLIVANDVTGFGSDQNEVVIIDRQGGEEKLPLLSKDRVAEHIMKRVVEML